jgi:hypothetical protein
VNSIHHISIPTLSTPFVPRPLSFTTLSLKCTVYSKNETIIMMMMMIRLFLYACTCACKHVFFFPVCV